MNDRWETIDINVCVDCAMLIANGETSPDWTEEQERAFIDSVEGDDGQWPWWQGWHLSLGSSECEWCGSEAQTEAHEHGEYLDDCEPWFSMSSCDGCGSHLGGDRMHAIAMLDLANPNAPKR